ncbi:MAG: helix-turn-helix transcriptional regulator [Clostridia bacterium]|nr:helix-turn-helix transcriptional regulator [Clostridia bacterium]MBQ7113635.1 helix-turn-helix transcriptional regulator [Clostridia bacterium]
MDQIKIGKFIAACRKKENLTQMQLAEKLNITDRAVSKWERGKAMPDSSIMLALCDVLNISVNDLLCGEVVTVENYNRELENNLLEMIRQKEQADKHLLALEWVIGIMTVVILLSLVGVASYVQMETGLRVALIVLGFILFFVGAFFALRIEQVAGYYECGKCGHRYVPTYKTVNLAMHVGRTRYMRCPECGQRSWQKKKLTKE